MIAETLTASTSPPEPRFAADIALDGAALSGYGEPAAVIDGNGKVLAANGLFSAIHGLTQSGQAAPAVIEAVASLSTPKGPPRRTITVKGDTGELVFDLTILPLAQAGYWLILAADRTMEVSLRNALADSRARFRDLVKVSSDYAWETSGDGCFSMITPRGLAGLTAKELIGQPADKLLDPDTPPVAVLPFTSPVPVHKAELWLRHIDGRSLCFEISAVPLYDKDAVWVGARGVCRDVTMERQYRTVLAEQRQRDRVFSRITSVFRREADPNDMLQAAASASTHGFVASGCQIYSAAPNLTNAIYQPQLTQAATFGLHGQSELSDSVISRLTPRDKEQAHIIQVGDWSVLAAPAIYGGRLVGAILLWRAPERLAWTEGDAQLLGVLAGQLASAIEQRSQHHLLLDASRTDALTSLLNRRGFYDEMKRRFNRLQRDNRPAALVYVDLDNFKLVNDTYGHARGDEALRHVADILRHNTRSTDLVARLGGDEFAIWLDMADEQVAVSRAQIFLAAGGPLTGYSGQTDRPLKLSIGIAVHHPKDREDINQFMSRADAAMYAVKRAGKGNYALAAPPIQP